MYKKLNRYFLYTNQLATILKEKKSDGKLVRNELKYL